MSVCANLAGGCVCILAQRHKGSCACECGGRWLIDEAGNFYVVEAPGLARGTVPVERDDYDEMLALGIAGAWQAAMLRLLAT